MFVSIPHKDKVDDYDVLVTFFKQSVSIPHKDKVDSNQDFIRSAVKESFQFHIRIR